MTARYWWQYSAVATYSRPIQRHSFSLRITPLEEVGQRTEACRVMCMDSTLTERRTAAGNILYGHIKEPHTRHIFGSEGVVALDDAAARPADRLTAALWLSPTPLTRATPQMTDTLPKWIGWDERERAVRLCRHVYETMRYEPYSTLYTTTAAEAYEQGCGVCQDFAHIMLALCRAEGLPARYVSGLLDGEGATHAWVEVMAGGEWLPLDPTHGRKVRAAEGGYIKWSHGRDARETDVVRGNYLGLCTETAEVRAVVYKI